MTTGPGTLGDLGRNGKLLWLHCNACGREVEVAPLFLGLPPEHPVATVKHRLKCGVRGSNKIDSKPELYPGEIAGLSGEIQSGAATTPEFYRVAPNSMRKDSTCRRVIVPRTALGEIGKARRGQSLRLPRLA